VSGPPCSFEGDAMRIMLVYTNIGGFHENCYSPGLAYLVSATLVAGHAVSVELVETPEEIEFLKDVFVHAPPHVVGFSSVASQFPHVRIIARTFKRMSPSTKVICGGVHPTIHPDCLLDSPEFDGAIRGEAEAAFLEYLDRLETGDTVETCPNYAYVKAGQVVKNPMNPLVADLDNLYPPDKDTYPYIRAVARAGHAPFFFSRGCPYPCTYCCNHAIAEVYGLTSPAMRYRSPSASVSEIEAALERYPLERIVIRDDIFGLDPRWRDQFCELFRCRIGRPFSVFSRVEIVSDRYCEALSRAGCVNVSMAVESGCPEIRQVLGRPMSDEAIIEAFDRVASFGIGTTAINMVGLPGETEEMIWQTIRLNRRINPNDTRANVFYPYRGTTLGDMCFENGLVDHTRYSLFSNERRESVLHFPQHYAQKINWYHNNWKKIVSNPMDFPDPYSVGCNRVAS